MRNAGSPGTDDPADRNKAPARSRRPPHGRSRRPRPVRDVGAHQSRHALDVPVPGRGYLVRRTARDRRTRGVELFLGVLLPAGRAVHWIVGWCVVARRPRTRRRGRVARVALRADLRGARRRARLRPGAAWPRDDRAGIRSVGRQRRDPPADRRIHGGAVSRDAAPRGGARRKRRGPGDGLVKGSRAPDGCGGGAEPRPRLPVDLRRRSVPAPRDPGRRARHRHFMGVRGRLDGGAARAGGAAPAAADGGRVPPKRRPAPDPAALRAHGRYPGAHPANRRIRHFPGREVRGRGRCGAGDRDADRTSGTRGDIERERRARSVCRPELRRQNGRVCSGGTAPGWTKRSSSRGRRRSTGAA